LSLTPGLGKRGRFSKVSQRDTELSSRMGVNMKIFKFLQSLLLSAFVLILVFFIAEIALRVVSANLMIFDIEMYKYAKQLKRRSNIPGLNHEHIPNSSAKLMGVDFKTNNLGLRDSDIPEKKNLGEYRVLVLGASITMGWGVPFEKVFTELLQEELSIPSKQIRKLNIINGGVANYNATIEAISLEKLFKEVKPDAVLLHYFLRDAEIIPDENQPWIISHSYLAAFSYIKSKQALTLFKTKNKGMGYYYKELYSVNSQSWKNAKAAILKMKNLCESQYKIPFIVAIQPDLHDISANSDQIYCHEQINSFLESNGIYYYNLLKDFQEKIANPQKIWVNHDDAHPNEEGHRIIADALKPFLEQLLSSDSHPPITHN